MEKDTEQKAPRQPHLIPNREGLAEGRTKKSAGTDEGGEGGTAGNWGGGATVGTEEEGPAETATPKKRSASGT